MRKYGLFFCIGSLFISGITPAQETVLISAAVSSESSNTRASVNEPLVTLTRMEICSTVADRSPVDIDTRFPASKEKVYCFLEFGGARKETSVDVIWTYGQVEVGRVNLPVRRFPLFSDLGKQNNIRDER